MSTELTNLLPKPRFAAFRKRYFLRLATVFLVALTVLIVLHALLLVPTYLFARGEAVRGRAEVAALNAAAETTEEQELASRTALLRNSVAAVVARQAVPEVTAALRAVLAVPRSGIALTGFNYTAPLNANTQGRLGVSGVASSRDALRAYAAALGALPFVSAADLPISAYAKESDIEFTITLTGTLKP
ncbi:MAG TPA: hypothetical protein VGB97_03715 [Candidatus Paceibacterota bacterium]|jgi:Tfp pilus assembly protein PilN